jgi:uncharacterized membrane protein YciS (DUF1049 family)
MFQTVKKVFKLCIYAIVILLGVTFAVGNRARVDVSFFPLPYAASVPLFLFAIIIFALGILLGWLIARYGSLKSHLSHKKANNRIAALENELAALRSQQLIKSPSLPPRL